LAILHQPPDALLHRTAARTRASCHSPLLATTVMHANPQPSRLYAQRMETMEWELLAAAQAAHKATLDAGLFDTVFKVGDRPGCCCGPSSCSTPQISASWLKLRPRWDVPFSVTACPSPNAYTLALPSRMQCSPTVNVDRLKPFFERAGMGPSPRAGVRRGAA
jgi:hypothetical protein